MKHALPLLALAVIPAASQAQNVLSTTVRAGYTISGSFGGKNGGSGNLVGPEVGIDIPIGLPIPTGGLGPIQFSISPSYFYGGLQTGSDYQGDVVRLIAVARLNLPGSPIYIRVGAGYSYASAINSDFNSVGAYETQLTVGYAILNNLPTVKLSAEISYHQSSSAQVSGFTFGIAFKF